jgi:hypothetical protein
MAMGKGFNRKVQTVNCEGLVIDYVEAGSGHPIIVFPGKDDDSTDLIIDRVGESYRIICLKLPAPDHQTISRIAEKLPQALTRLGIEHCSIIAFAASARFAISLAASAPERIDKLILLSPLLSDGGGQVPDLDGIKVTTLVLVGVRDGSGAIEAGRLCREKIASCHLSFIYGAGEAPAAERPDACLEPIVQFLEEGEQFIISHESQVIRR